MAPLDNTTKIAQSVEPSNYIGSFFKHTLTLSDTADVYLEMSEWRKGYVWLNGFNLGRFWHVGP
jgi:beta-galactosidase